MITVPNMRIPGERKATTRASPTILTASLRLRRAIHHNDPSLVARILKASPHLLHNPDHTSSTSPLSNSNLHLAASLGHLPIVRLLVAAGHESPSPALNENNQTALMLAAVAGHTDVVHFLAETFPQVILRKDKRGRDAIMEAADGAHDTALQLLLTYAPGGPEAALAAGDNEGNTALHFASAGGNLMVLRTLVAAGGDPLRENNASWTAMNYAESVHTEVHLRNLMADAESRRQQQQTGKEGLGLGIGRVMKMRLMGS